MFGSENRLEKSLRENGAHTAPAQVLEAKASRWVTSTGNTVAEELETSKVSWKLKLHVTPDGEAAFDANIKASFPQMGGTSVGDTLGVLYDPNDHSKLVIDHGTEGVATQALAGMSPEAQAALSSVGGESAGDLVKEALADPAAFREKMQAAGAGPVVMVGGQQISGARVAATPDPADEIAKLADLKDRGALTEAEFEAQKKRVLGT